MVNRRVRRALSPGWLVLHVVTLAIVVTMVLLGRWQLDVSNAKHFNLQNFGYALQWWAFSAFALGMWVRILLDRGGRRAATPDSADIATAPDAGASGASEVAEPAAQAQHVVAYRRYVMPQSNTAPVSSADPELAAYNDYLARLDRESSASSGAEGTAS